METKSRLLITMGDVAGIGPEILARAWPALTSHCLPIVVGDVGWLVRALKLVGSTARVQIVQNPKEVHPDSVAVSCINPQTPDLERVAVGRTDAAAGRAAYEFLVAAIDLTMAGQADGIVTAPLH